MFFGKEDRASAPWSGGKKTNEYVSEAMEGEEGDWFHNVLQPARFYHLRVRGGSYFTLKENTSYAGVHGLGELNAKTRTAGSSERVFKEPGELPEKETRRKRATSMRKDNKRKRRKERGVSWKDSTRLGDSVGNNPFQAQ